MDRVIFLVHGVRGVWLNMFHVCFDRPCFAPSGWGRLLNLVIFGFLPVTGAHVFVGVGVWCVFGWVWAFHGLFLLKRFCGEFDPGSG